MQDKNIVMTSDHAGATLKQTIAKELEKEGYHVLVLGPLSEEDKADYPDMAKEGALKIKEGVASKGIFICGSGVGMSICANRNPKIRAALCWTPAIAALARQHNNANVLVLPGRFIKKAKAIRIVKEFLTSQYEAGRHAKRLKKL